MALRRQGRCCYRNSPQAENLASEILSFMGRDPVELAKRAKYQPPAMRVRGVCYTKKSPFRYNEVVQANL